MQSFAYPRKAHGGVRCVRKTSSGSFERRTRLLPVHKVGFWVETNNSAAFWWKSKCEGCVIAILEKTPGCQMRPQKNYFRFRARKWLVLCSQMTSFRSETYTVQLVFKEIRINTVKNRQNQDSLGCQMRPQTFFEPKTTLKLHELSWKHYGMVL